MPSALDITGLTFGRLIAIAPTDLRSGGKIVWRCTCNCGAECLAPVNHLQDGRRVSCGCAKLTGSQRLSRKARHGHYVGNQPSPTYSSWTSMRTRCLNPNAPDFMRYGGRGIVICQRWTKFENFLADMGERPAKHTLDRKDTNGHYEPENCRWATQITQDRNKRTNRVLEAFGRQQILGDWVRETGIPSKTITDRLKRGWAVERALRR